MARERPAEQPSPAGLTALAGVRLHLLHTLSERHFGFTVKHGFTEGNINAEGAASYCRIEAGTDEALDEDERAEKKSSPGGGSLVSAEGGEDHGDPKCLAQPPGLTLQMWGKEESLVLGVLNLNCPRDTQVKT